MATISEQEFLIRQPQFPHSTSTDKFYFEVANQIYDLGKNLTFRNIMPDGIARRIALTLTDYLQDIVADSGLWRSFVEANRALYGWPVPFHDVTEEYVDYELNREDIRFLVWYVIAMLWDEKRLIYPHHVGLLQYADCCYDFLEAVYEESPVPEGFRELTLGVDLKDQEDKERVYHLGNWLFLHSYLLTPAFAATLQEIMAETDSSDPDFASKLNRRLEEAMIDETTGPLALFTPEWVYLILNGKLPKIHTDEHKEEHKYYKSFVKATGGKTILFFDSYTKMNQFFIESLGWEAGTEHLAQAKGADDYILMVNPDKGMLMARNIARCVKSPDNSLFNEAYARRHSMELLTERGCCPGDLLKVIFENKWLPFAHFPESDDYKLVEGNQDIIARCYLQLFYRGD